MGRTAEIIAGIIGAVSLLVLFIALFIRSLKRSESPSTLIVKWVVTFVLLFFGVHCLRDAAPFMWPPIAALFAIPIGLIWTPTWAAFLFRPLTSVFDGGGQEPDPVPIYSIAQNKRGKGQFNEAIWTIREQLEKFPGDFNGMMLIATIQAEDLKDIQGAEATIEHLLADPKRPATAVATALNSLADWELSVGQNPEAAAAALKRITERFPDTPVAVVAAQRIARLENPTAVKETHKREPIRVKAGLKNIGLQTGLQTAIPEVDPSVIANGYVKQLEKHPQDWDTREKLAVLYAEHYKRFDLAEEQLEQLIAQPDQTPARISRWLDLLATLCIKEKRDVAYAEKTLRRIITAFPGSAPAERALNRLATLQSELKAAETVETKKLGSYERDLGLKTSQE